MKLKQNVMGIFFVPLASALVLGSYEFVRSPSTTLFKAAFGTQNLPIVMALMPIAVFLTVYIYGLILSKEGPRKTLFISHLLSGLVVLGCYAMIQQGITYGSAILYVFRQAYIVILIEQYWSLINSTLNSTQAKKANGPIAGIASLGAILGGLGVGYFATRFGSENLILVGGLLIFPAALLSDLAFRFCGEPEPKVSEARGKKGHLHLSLFKEKPLLTCILSIVLMTQVLSAFLDLTFQNILQNEIPNINQQTAYSGLFFAKVNGLAAFFQFILAPILLWIMPIGMIHLSIPFVHLIFSFWLIQSPSLAIAATAFLLFKSLDYSLFRASKEILYIPLSFDARYRAKEMIDVFGYRLGKGITSLSIGSIQSLGIILTPFFAWGATFAAGIWFVLIFPILKFIPKRERPYSNVLEKKKQI